MMNYKRISFNSIAFNIDLKVYSDIVISKTLYWLAEDFIIERYSVDDFYQHIVLEKKKNDLSEEEIIRLKIKINQNLVDFKLRSIINDETRNIRDILYVKAFANNDDFEDYNLSD